MIYKAPYRRFYNEEHYQINWETQTIKLNPEFHKRLLSFPYTNPNGFRKLTGTALGDILEVDNFKSQFAAFARLCGLAMPVLDEKYIRAGVILEPKILSLVEQAIGEELQRFDAKEYQYDYFKENKLFGGLPDGFAKQNQIIIEIKTTNEKNYDFWTNKEVPIGYQKQAQLYAYLMGVDSFSIVAIFLKDEDYTDPNQVDILKRKIKNFNFKVNKAQVLDDIKFCEEWYNQYTKSGISPKWKNGIDNDLIEYLKCKNQDEWTQLYNHWIAIKKAVPNHE
ncbi:MAGa7180 family putative nuclease [[Mycoplasma] anseris]|uniref:MAGa7180 family putative nuclease n=1 Tax=[Mycoplasma] anseris TaxID=92400 RepID=UPI00051E4B67|nr:YqaJ viral recombinase family protein [[Mycoplasma] anseris]